MAEIAVNLVLDNLKQLMMCKADLLLHEMGQIKSLYEELGFLRTFVGDWEEMSNEHEEVKDLVTRIRDVAYEAENIIELFVVDSMAKNAGDNFRCIEKKKKKKKKKAGDACEPSLNLRDVRKEIKAIKTKSLLLGMSSSKGSTSSESNRPNTFSKVEEETMIGFDRPKTLRVEEEIVVGFEDEANTIKEQLTAGGHKQLEVISIVGMPGLGKTTLARKVYDDPLTVYYFYIRAWINISQEYRKRDVLLATFGCFEHLTNRIYKMSDEEIGGMIYRRLKGKKYLIVLDDIWNIKAWDDLKIFFPNDYNGSRIIFTSRLADVALCVKFASPPHFLRFLTEDESWELFQHKAFQGQTCPPEFTEIGMQITKKCQQLPLTIVVVAGILAKKERQQDSWKCVLETLSSYVASDPQDCMKTLALSYSHLPHHLKPCLLYFGAFPEDYEIPVQKLVWLWIAEGFIPQIGQKSLEDLAEEYLMDLVNRSLVLVSNIRSDSRIKACCIHDLLRDFCLTKAKEENFLQQISTHQNASSSKVCSPNKHLRSMRCWWRGWLAHRSHSFLNKHLRPSGICRLCTHSKSLDCVSLFPSKLNVRSILCFSTRAQSILPTKGTLFWDFKEYPFHSQGFKLLKVLDISLISSPDFPSEIEQLILLRYLSLRGSLSSLPTSLSNLLNLETIVLSVLGNVGLPHSIWKMVKLRHLYITSSCAYYIESPQFHEESSGDTTSLLENLQTLSYSFSSRSCQDVLARIPNIRKLALRGEITSTPDLSIYVHLENLTSMPDLGIYVHLENLKLFYTGPCLYRSINSRQLKLPPNLRKLTLEGTSLEWEAISTLGMLLPMLEVLKLRAEACTGPHWETNFGAFPRLKFLQLQDLDILQWSTSSNHFPCLQRLVLSYCVKLEEIPSDLGDIPTLQLIEVRCCSRTAHDSAKKIKDEQESMGNNWLRILIVEARY